MSETAREEQEVQFSERYVELFGKLYTLWLALQQKEVPAATLQKMRIMTPYGLRKITLRSYPDHGVALYYMPRVPDTNHVFAATLGFHRMGANSANLSEPISTIQGGASLLRVEKTGEMGTNMLGKSYQIEKRELPGLSFTILGLNDLIENDQDGISPGLQLREGLLSHSHPVVTDLHVGYGSDDTADPHESALIQQAIVDFWEPILKFV